MSDALACALEWDIVHHRGFDKSNQKEDQTNQKVNEGVPPINRIKRLMKLKRHASFLPTTVDLACASRYSGGVQVICDLCTSTYVHYHKHCGHTVFTMTYMTCNYSDIISLVFPTMYNSPSLSNSI